MRASVQSIARSSASDPAMRLPKVSVSSAIRFHAALSFVAASINRSVAARYVSGVCAVAVEANDVRSAAVTSIAAKVERCDITGGVEAGRGESLTETSTAASRGQTP